MSHQGESTGLPQAHYEFMLSSPLFSNVLAFTEFALRPASLRFFLMRPASVACSSSSLIILCGGLSPFLCPEPDAVVFSFAIIVTKKLYHFRTTRNIFRLSTVHACPALT